mgnify:CR=1 FL=1|tara:strand:- start:702 stop:1721 length:1020 start_codon:yes stop_codon:yes gene_type:complete
MMGMGRQRQWQWVEDYCVWLEDGSGPREAAEAMRTQAAYFKLDAEQKLAERLQIGLRRGQTIARALRGELKQDLLELFLIGQQYNCLTDLLNDYRDVTVELQHLRWLFYKQLLYPVSILLTVLLAYAYAASSYLPKLLSYTESKTSDWTVAWVLSVGNNIASGWWWWLVSIATGLFCWRWTAQNWTGAYRTRLERYGIFAQYRALNALWLTRLVAVLMHHRVALDTIFAVLKRVASPYARWHLTQMQRRLAQGRVSLAIVLDTGLLLPRQLFRISHRQQFSGQREALIKVAQRSYIDIQRSIAYQQRLWLVLCYLVITGLLLLLLSAVGNTMMRVMMSI